MRRGKNSRKKQKEVCSSVNKRTKGSIHGSNHGGEKGPTTEFLPVNQQNAIGEKESQNSARRSKEVTKKEMDLLHKKICGSPSTN